MKKAIFTLVAIACTLVGNNAFAQNDPLLASILKIISPVEVSNMIKTQGIEYNNTILNKATNVPKYTSEFKRAVNLGIFSTDLGYATINDKSSDALTYLTQVKALATTLKVEKFINTGRIMQLAMNKDDMNKLLDETSTTFEKISDDLDKQKKGNLAALMLTGGWLETFYITAEVAKTKPSSELSERIVGQKEILVQIIDVLKTYTKNDADTKKLHGQLVELNTVLDAYKIVVTASTEKEPITEERKDKDGNPILVTTGGSNSKEVNLTAEDLAKISSKVTEIRKTLVE